MGSRLGVRREPYGAFPPEGLAQAAQRLAAVLEEENEALRDMAFARAGGLLTAKCAAADALDASLRAAASDPKHDNVVATFYDDVIACLAPLITENQELHRRSARLQKRVHALVERLATRAGTQHRPAASARTVATPLNAA